MRKFVAILAVVLCTCTLFACKDTVGVISSADGPTTITVGNLTDEASLSSYIDAAVALVKNAAIPAADEDFISLYAVRGEMYDIMSTIGKGDYSSPVKVQIITPDRNATLKAIEESGENTEFSMLYKMGKFGLGSFASSYNATFGANTLAATSVLTAETGFAMREGFGDDFAVILTYGGDYSALVSYSKLGEVIRAQAFFIRNAQSGNAEIENVLSDIGMVYTIHDVK